MAINMRNCDHKARRTETYLAQYSNVTSPIHSIIATYGVTDI